MDAETLRRLQAPIKARYKEDPAAARHTFEASGVLRALQSVVAHDRLDAEFESEQDQVAAADELLTP
mgnify:CR=1 FL=1